MFIGLCPLLAYGHVDDFSDGNYTSNPVWSGEVDYFHVNENRQLQSNGPAEVDTLRLFTEFAPDLTDTITWSWYWRMQFDPSSNNTSRVYLMSTDSSIGEAGQAYFIRLGENGSSDVLKFYRSDGQTETLVASGNTIYLRPESRTARAGHQVSERRVDSALKANWSNRFYIGANVHRYGNYKWLLFWDLVQAYFKQ